MDLDRKLTSNNIGGRQLFSIYRGYISPVYGRLEPPGGLP